ncbi:hypothetical protein ABBQ38_006731 [Trebouxia sp. C0009 RCD-2024]
MLQVACQNWWRHQALLRYEYRSSSAAYPTIDLLQVVKDRTQQLRLVSEQQIAISTTVTLHWIWCPTLPSLSCQQGVFSATGRAGCLRLATHCHSNQTIYVQQGGPDISRLHPALQQQWDHTANAHLGNIDIKPQSNRKGWWRCDQCPDGHLHRWSALVCERTTGSGCPQCSGREVCKHNSLATKAPKVAARWDYDVNTGTPESVVAHSNTEVGWKCRACGCKWRTSPNARVRKNRPGCPECASNAKTGKKQTRHPMFAECRHPLLAEWDHKRNAIQGNYPDNTTLRSNKKIFWLCTNCPAGQEHGWPAMPSNRTGRNATGCPFCAGHAACRCNSLQALYPDIAAEWDHSKKQGQPSDHTASSTFLAWWSSPQCASWQQHIHSRTNSVQKRTARHKHLHPRQEPASEA